MNLNPNKIKHWSIQNLVKTSHLFYYDICRFGKSVSSGPVFFLVFLSLSVKKVLKVDINSTKITSIFN